MDKKKRNLLKRMLLVLVLTLISLIFGACVESSITLGNQNEESSSLSNTQNTGLMEEITGNTYTITHEKDNSVYTMIVTQDSDGYSTVQIFDEASKNLQSIHLESRIPEGIELMDVNLDGYTDIVANIGGTLNETHELYTWDNDIKNFAKVVFKGFDLLSYFEVHEGYLKNWSKDSASSGVVQKLIWEGNTLTMDSEEKYELDD